VTKAKKKDNGRYVVPNLERALQIIEMMAQEPKSCGITEISNELGFPKNSVFRILKTLLIHDFIIETNRQYRLSAKFLSLGYANLGEVNLVEKAIDVMRELKNEAKETVLIGTIIELNGVVLEQVLGSYEIKFSIDVGHRFYLHTAAPGKAMLAFLPEEERERMLNSIEYKRFNPRTIKTKKELYKTLETARQKGYAVDLAERIEGLHGVASPIMNYLNYPVASIWVTGPSYRMPESELNRLGPIVKKYADKISQRLGYES
jgi:DNA-binding IclR family transcriptional regulator